MTLVLTSMVNPPLVPTSRYLYLFEVRIEDLEMLDFPMSPIHYMDSKYFMVGTPTIRIKYIMRKPNGNPILKYIIQDWFTISS